MYLPFNFDFDAISSTVEGGRIDNISNNFVL
jgi:hypothetical protein